MAYSKPLSLAYDYVIEKQGTNYICYNDKNNRVKTSTEAATAIQYAIDQLTPNAGLIYIKPVPNGVYEINTDITIANGHEGLNIIGGGYDWSIKGTVLKATSDLTDSIIDDNHNGIGFHRFIGLSFLGQEAANAWGDNGISTLCQDTIIQHCSFRDLSGGVIAKSNAWIEGCWMEQCTTKGVQISGTKPKILNNIFWQNGNYDIYLSSNCNDAVIMGNTTAGTGTDYFVYFRTGAYHSQRCIVSNNIADELDEAMFWLMNADMTHHIFGNNILDGAGTTKSMFKVQGLVSTYTDILMSNNIGKNLATGFTDGDTTGLTIQDNIS